MTIGESERLGVQIMSSRLKILLMPPGRGLVPPFDQAAPEEAANMSPVIMTGEWEDRKADYGFQGRLRLDLISASISKSEASWLHLLFSLCAISW